MSAVPEAEDGRARQVAAIHEALHPLEPRLTVLTHPDLKGCHCGLIANVVLDALATRTARDDERERLAAIEALAREADDTSCQCGRTGRFQALALRIRALATALPAGQEG